MLKKTAMGAYLWLQRRKRKQVRQLKKTSFIVFVLNLTFILQTSENFPIKYCFNPLQSSSQSHINANDTSNSLRSHIHFPQRSHPNILIVHYQRISRVLMQLNLQVVDDCGDSQLRLEQSEPHSDAISRAIT
jgi:hypothetical protein